MSVAGVVGLKLNPPGEGFEPPPKEKDGLVDSLLKLPGASVAGKVENELSETVFGAVLAGVGRSAAELVAVLAKPEVIVG